MKRYFSVIILALIWSCSYNSLDEKDLVDCSISDLSIQIDEVINSDCWFGNRAITVVVSGGTLPCSFTLNEGTSRSSPEFNQLEASNYATMVIDTNGCKREVEAIVQNKYEVNANLSIS